MHRRYDTDAVRRPLRYVLDKLAMPLLGIFQTLLKLVDANAANKDALEQVLKGACASAMVCRVLHSPAADLGALAHLAPHRRAHRVPHLLLAELDDDPRGVPGQPAGLDAGLQEDLDLQQQAAGGP